MNQNPTTPGPPRVRISCPGCGRNDHVSWPPEAATYHWKCFNCNKEFNLSKSGKH